MTTCAPISGGVGEALRRRRWRHRSGSRPSRSRGCASCPARRRSRGCGPPSRRRRRPRFRRSGGARWSRDTAARPRSRARASGRARKVRASRRLRKEAAAARRPGRRRPRARSPQLLRGHLHERSLGSYSGPPLFVNGHIRRNFPRAVGHSAHKVPGTVPGTVGELLSIRAWGSRCPSSGAIATGCTSRAARSMLASARPAPSFPIAPNGYARCSRHPEAASRRRPSIRTPRRSRCTIPRWSSTSAPHGMSGRRAGLAEDPGQDRVVPYLFPHPGLVGGHHFEPATHMAARAGTFCFDTMTLIGPGTWKAARAAVDVALTAADLVIAGERAAYALCRPPGHHVTRNAFGGSCYLNNAAAAAARLRDALGARRAHRHRRPSRKRRPVDLLGGRLRLVWLGPRGSGGRVVPALPRVRRRDRSRGGRWGEPERAPGSRRGRSRVGGCYRDSRFLGDRPRGAGRWWSRWGWTPPARIPRRPWR